ncbi:MAG: hypothetical protein GY926_03370 [bacterium]|nr:hypothetical protein [bacterium]MCP4964255.1 hypothetical protein [bacterium]
MSESSNPSDHASAGSLQRLRRRVLGVPAAGFLVIVLAAIATYAAWRTWSAAEGFCVVCLELAGTEAAARELVDSLSGAELADVRTAIRYDSWYFIPAYASALWAGCRWAAGEFRTPRLNLAGISLGWGALGAGVLDYVENLAIIRMLSGSYGVWPQVSAAAAVPKFVLAFLAVLCVVAGLFAQGSGRTWRRLAGEWRAVGMALKPPPGATAAPVSVRDAPNPLAVYPPETALIEAAQAFRDDRDPRLQLWAKCVLSSEKREPGAKPAGELDFLAYLDVDGLVEQKIRGRLEIEQIRDELDRRIREQEGGES